MKTRSFRILGAALAALLPACGGGGGSGGASAPATGGGDANPAFPVTMMEPSGGQIFTAPATIPLSAVAADPGSVAKVEFLQDVGPGGEIHWIGGSVVATFTQAPFQASATDVPAGIHTFVARSTDALGTQTFSNAVTINVLPPGESPGGWVPIARVYGVNLLQGEIWLVDADRGWVVGAAAIQHTVDGGATWVQQFGSGFRLGKGQFIDADRGWVIVADGPDGGSVLRTTDGGATWIPHPTGAFLNAISFVDSNTGWGVGRNVVATKDGGLTWTALPAEMSDPGIMVAVRFVDPLNGWVLGTDVILHTTDGGLTWTEQFRAGSNGFIFAGMDFVDAKTGWVSNWRFDTAGNSLNGGILFTNDGGATWTEQTYLAKDAIRALDFISSTQGWGVGDSGTIIHTEDGGRTWATQTLGIFSTFPSPSSPPIDFLRDVRFLDANQGWLLSGSGVILKTTTGGKAP